MLCFLPPAIYWDGSKQGHGSKHKAIHGYGPLGKWDKEALAENEHTFGDSSHVEHLCSHRGKISMTDKLSFLSYIAWNDMVFCIPPFCMFMDQELMAESDGESKDWSITLVRRHRIDIILKALPLPTKMDPAGLKVSTSETFVVPFLKNKPFTRQPGLVLPDSIR